MSDFKAKMHQSRFRLELRPRPRWGSLQRSHRSPIAVFKGPTSKGKEVEGEERREREGKRKEERRGRRREGNGGEGKTTLHTTCGKILDTPLSRAELIVYLLTK